MGEVYRIKVKTENFEIEVEGPSKEFVETYADKIMKQAEQPAVSAPASPAVEKKTTRRRGRPRKVTEAEVEVKAPEGAEVAITEENGEQVAVVTPKTKPRKRKSSKAKASSAMKEAEASAQEAELIDPEQVAAAIKNSEYYPIIKEKVLDARNQLNKILVVAYYILKTYNRRPATVGTFEAITEALGVGLKSSNISTQIKKRLDLFDTVDVKRRRVVKGYILNKNGVNFVENNLLKAD
ncbi:MAG: hypothetical protein D6818_11045 [Bacteroidetes bacterium]|nr:MAG: hypothetical protein D6818_11045 [Bacteroidota bacterium]